MSLPPTYGLWIERPGGIVGYWHSCFGPGGPICLFDSEEGPKELLRDGYDNSLHYSARAYDPGVGDTPRAHMGHFHNLPADLVQIQADVRPIVLAHARNAFNPSIVMRDGFVYVALRVIIHKGASRNYLARLHTDGSTYDVREIEDRISLEDVRLVVRDGWFWGTATVLEPRPRVAVIQLHDEGRVLGVHVQESTRDEKNWMPFVDGPNLKLVYSVDPIPTVLDFDDALKRVFPSATEVRHVVHAYRGGAQVIEWEDGYLLVVHHVNLDRGYPVYLHRFVKCDKTMTDVQASRPFYFCSRGIEFVAGVVARGDTLLLSFGLADQTSQLATVRREEVARLFRAE